MASDELNLEDFFKKYPVDERAQSYMLQSSDDVVKAVFRGFRPQREGEADYSGLLTAYVKKIRQNTSYNQGGGWNPPPHSGGGPAANGYGYEEEDDDPALKEELADFMLKYPLDDGARNYLMGSLPEVQVRIINEFRPKKEGEDDYSALLMTFAKRCRGDARAAVAHEAQRQAASGGGHFAPWHASSSGAAPPWHSQAPPHAVAPSDQEMDAWCQRYPVDERAYDYFRSQMPEVQQKVLAEFKPKVEGESDYSGLFTTFVKRCRNTLITAAPQTQAQPYNGGSWGAPHAPVQGGWHVRQQGPDYEGFRQRFPMDERAFEYLKGSSPEVGHRVLATFVPPRLDDTDFSAPVTAYVRQCRRAIGYTGPVGGGPVGGYPAVQYVPETLVMHARPTGPPAGSYPAPGRYPPLRPPAQSYRPTSAPSTRPVPSQAWSQSPPARPQPAAHSIQLGDQDARIQQFLHRYPVDERAADFFCTSSPSVIDRVMAEFQPKKEGDSDYSAIVMSFTKRCRDQERASYGGGGGAVHGGGYGGGGGAPAHDEYGAPAWKRARTYEREQGYAAAWGP